MSLSDMRWDEPQDGGPARGLPVTANLGVDAISTRIVHRCCVPWSARPTLGVVSHWLAVSHIVKVVPTHAHAGPRVSGHNASRGVPFLVPFARHRRIGLLDRS